MKYKLTYTQVHVQKGNHTTSENLFFFKFCSLDFHVPIIVLRKAKTVTKSSDYKKYT